MTPSAVNRRTLRRRCKGGTCNDGSLRKVGALCSHRLPDMPMSGHSPACDPGNMQEVWGDSDPEFRQAIEGQRFCDEWENLSPDTDGPMTFVCACGVMNGQYQNYVTGEAALDRHLDDQERALMAFTRRWWAEHRPGV